MMQRTARNNRRRQSLWFEQFEPRRLLAGLDGTGVEVYGPLPAPVLELPLVAPRLPAASFAGNDAAWMRSQGLTGADQTVVLIDSGIAYDHVALGGGFGAGFKVVGGWDFAENDGDPYDDGPAGFHGTHVGGIVGGRDGIRSGVAPDVALVALRVFSDSGATQASWIESALRWVHEHRLDYATPITAVNLSIGTAGEGAESALQAALDDELALLRRDGVFVAVSAGNRFSPQHAGELSYPAASPWVMPVASADAHGQLSGFSQRDGRVLVAPGENIVSAAPDFLLGADGQFNDYVAATGTSMAAPQVAAASVLVRQALRKTGSEEPSVAQIEQALRDGADQIYDAATLSTYARLNLRRTLEHILSLPETPASSISASQAIDAPWPTGAAWTIGQDATPNQLSWHTWEVVNSGFVTLQAWQDSPAIDSPAIDSPALEAFDARGERLAASRTMPDGSMRLDVTAQAGDRLTFSVSNPSSAAQLRLTNLVFQNGVQLQLRDTRGDDRLRIMAGVTLDVRIHEVDYQFPLAGIQYVDFQGTEGRDEAVIDSRARGGTARAIVTPQDAQVRSASLTIRVANVDATFLLAGSGRDEALLVDGLADDQFRLAAQDALWNTPTGSVQLNGYDDVTVLATRGGDDGAVLVDSPQAGRLDIRATEVRWNAGGTDYVLRGLERLTTTSAQGGRDAANVQGGADDDRVQAIDYLYRKLGNLVKRPDPRVGFDIRG